MGVAGTAAVLGRFLTRQQDASFELGGETGGWQGRAPDTIAGQTNPTLSLQAGQEYDVTWENVDGQPHNFAIHSSDGTALVTSEIMSAQGTTQTVTFTATAEMARYLCDVHPNTMVGDLSVSGEGGGTQTTQEPTTTTETPTDGGAGFFTQGARVSVETVADGMVAPTDYAVPGDDSGRQFVTDQTGEVWVITDEGRAETPFIDVSDRMVTLGEFNGSYANPTQKYDERGLLGIEFHPDFSTNRKFYLHYSAPPNDETPDGWDHVEIIAEFTATDDLSSGDPDSERVLLAIQKPQYNHDSGPIAFGPDGYLYIPMGDGGGANDDRYGHVADWYDANEGGNGQDITSNLLGNILRIDVDTEETDMPYGIPADNPFVDTDALDEIYAYGLRNPFGISFDSAGHLFVADAGQNLFEEVNVVEKGGNYGWNVKEGTHCFSTENPGEPDAITDCPTTAPEEAPYNGAPLIDPVVEFPHTYQGESVGITVIGGHRYENSAIADVQGKYVFGAWTTDPARNQPAGRILAATPPADFDSDGEDTTTTTADSATTQTAALWEMEELVVDGGFDYFVRMFGQGQNGDVYVLANKEGTPTGDTGVLLKLAPSEAETTTTPTATATPTETETQTQTGTATETTTGTGTETTTSSTGPGFDAVTSLVAALISVALLIRRRRKAD